MKKKIIVNAFSNLTTDQRIEKVCKTLHDNGYVIELIGCNYGCNQEVKREYTVEKINLISKSLKTAYFEFNWKLYQKLLNKSFENTVLLTNDLDTLLPNFLLSKKKKIPLVFDSHEIFTEMPAIQGKISQKIWRFAENKMLPHIEFMMTESESYAKWFHEKYNVTPVVVRNIPKKLPLQEKTLTQNPKIILYQGAINPSRGIDKAILAMKFIENANLIIVGDGPMRKKYEAFAVSNHLAHKVQFLGKKRPSELRTITQKANVGISLEENNGVSYYYSLPNKVADYIQARVPLVMINFPEMIKIKSKYNVGEVIADHHPETIANAINNVLNIGKENYLDELNKAAEDLCWENEESKILSLFEKAFQSITK